MTYSWLPALVLLLDHDGSWDRYLVAVYGYFKKDFLDSMPEFRGSRMGLKRHPVKEGKEATFWHFISEGEVEAERIPDIRRCERIRWPRQLIEQEEAQKLAVWRQMRRNEMRVAIALSDFSYVLILALRNTQSGPMYLPWTAFHIEHIHQRNRYRREWIENHF